MPSASPLPLLLACQAVIAAFASSHTLASALPPSTKTSTQTKSKPPTHKSLITKKRAAAAFPKTKPFPKKAADLPLPFPRHPSRPAAVFPMSECVSHLLPDEDEYDEHRELRRTKRRAARTDAYGAPYYQTWTDAANLPCEHRREVRVHFADFPGFSQLWSFADLCRHSVQTMREWPLCTRFGAELVFYYRRARFTKTQRKGDFQARWCPDSDVAGYRAFMAARPYRRF